MGAYFELGLQHITDLNGYDHILFLLALCAPFSISQWKKVAVLVTAFTLGHSLTLALAVLELVHVSSEWIEFLIPITILITAIYNGLSAIFNKEGRTHSSARVLSIYPSYLLALGFGLIHGLGFSNYLRSLLGSEIMWPLFNFNLGLEVGQLAIVAAGLAFRWGIANISLKAETWWPIVLSGVAALVAFNMALNRFPGL